MNKIMDGLSREPRNLMEIKSQLLSVLPPDLGFSTEDYFSHCAGTPDHGGAAYLSHDLGDVAGQERMCYIEAWYDARRREYSEWFFVFGNGSTDDKVVFGTFDDLRTCMLEFMLTGDVQEAIEYGDLMAAFRQRGLETCCKEWWEGRS